MKRLIYLLCLCGALTGCATRNEMAFNKESTAIDVSQKSVVLMSLDISHKDNSYYVPKAMVVLMETPDAKEKKDRQNFTVDEDGLTSTEDGHQLYMIRLAIEPGRYKLMSIFGNAGRFPLNGFFNLPLLMDVEVAPNSVTYVGKIEAVLRPREGEEFRAGSVIPLIDQAATGISGGTFDVVVSDASATDIPAMQAVFPVLSKTPIQKAILPPFDRPRVQRWWESDGDSEKALAGGPAGAAPVAVVPASAPTVAPATVLPAVAAPNPAGTSVRSLSEINAVLNHQKPAIDRAVSDATHGDASPGTVVVSFIVQADGTVDHLQIVSSTYADHAADAAVAASIQKVAFQPKAVAPLTVSAYEAHVHQ